ncbi:MAG: hypothetical protein HZA51_13080 [Planctomycetes bacterium]|nr:hypothetical protein [Planctomycetota bacterium]
MKTTKTNLSMLLRNSFLGGAIAIAPYIAKADVNVEPKDSVQTSQVARWERGRTYTVNVWAQNNEVDSVRGASWQLDVPAELQSFLNNTTYVRPTQSIDFFRGHQLALDTYSSAGNWCQAYLQSSSDSSPTGMQGLLESYDFAVNGNAPLGQFDFSVYNGSLDFVRNNASSMPITITEDQQFRIMPRKGDVNGDGVKNVADIAAFTQALLGNPTLQPSELYAGEYCDWSGNEDSSLNGKDIQNFVQNYLAP